MSKAIIEAARNAGLVVYSYSGRGMYGAKCLGVECDRDTSAIKVVCEIAKAFMDNEDFTDDRNSVDKNVATLYEMLGALERAKNDSMGLGSIVYWPDIKWTEEDEDSDE